MILRSMLFLSLLVSAVFVQVGGHEGESAASHVTSPGANKAVVSRLDSSAESRRRNAAYSVEDRTRMVVLKVLMERAKSISKIERDRLADAIIRYSEQHNHDPFLVLAVIETESSFRHSVISNKGAVGLMQIRPFVAKAQARELNITEKEATQLLDPATNVMIGTYYLAKMRKRFGNLSLALEAYNRGPTKLRKSLRAGHKLRKRYTLKVLRSRERLMNMINEV